jgi:DNA polymerase (family 10)
VSSAAALASTLRQLADLAEIRGGLAEAADLRHAAGAIDALVPELASRLPQLARRDRLADVVPLNPGVRWRVREAARDGGEQALRAARAGVPLLLRRLLELPAITSAQALTLARSGVATAADLSVFLDSGRGAMFGTEIEGGLKVAAVALSTEARPVTLSRAWEVLDGLAETLAAAAPALNALTAAGDARRFEPLVDGLVLVGRAADAPASVDAVCAAEGVDDVLHRTPQRAIIVYQHSEIDVRIAEPDEYGSVLFVTTGSRAHLAAMTARTSAPARCGREEDVYAASGLRWIPPELRHDSGEIEAAAEDLLPDLVTRDQIRGDLHIHSTYSDGLDTLETMVQRAVAIGHEYIAITDHSERANAARTVSRAGLARQRNEIARLRERYPEITILHGVEVDVMPNGRLDFSDEVLASLDIVLASVHDPAGQDGRQLTRRSIAALRHPLVNVLSHPANQLVGRRSGYPLDFDALYAAAAETGTALEIDGAPGHLDLDGEHARAAVAAGVTVTIDSDCHRARALERQMRFGVGTARRGWVERRHVLNTRSVEDVRAFIAAKRRRG